jgi:serine/threonine-protein kinase
MRLSVEIAPDTPLARAGSGNMLALSPDGARLALMLRGADGKARLHTRLLNESEVTPLMGTEDASDPFFSPDGEWIGFFADGKLKKISVNGGAAATLCDAPAGRGASWGDDGNIIAALDLRGVLSRVPSEGGTPVPVTKLNPGEQTHRWPQVLPGSQAVLFTSAAALAPSYDGANVEVVSLKTGERKTVERGGFFPRYLPTSTGTGHLVYLRGSTLFAVPFDPRRLATTGSPAPIIEDVAANNVGGGDFAFGGAPSGPATFVYLAGKEQGGWSILWVDRQGKTQPLAPRGPYLGPRFSPDGRRLAFAMLGGQSSADIWVKDLDRDTPSRLTFLRGRNGWPVWTPDGKNIVFASEDQATLGLYSIRSDGSGEPRRLTDGKLQEAPSSFSPDGKRLALFQNANAGNEDIFTAAVETDPASGGVRLGKAELFLGSPLSKWVPAFSPDGRWLAYQEGDVGRTEVYVRPFPGPGGKWQISTGGGRFPVWSRDGRELLFETPNFGVMTVNYTVKGDSFAAEQPRAWPGIHLWDAFVFPNYDLAPDGKHLAALVAGDPSIQKPPTHLTFLLNFYDELRRRAPGPK